MDNGNDPSARLSYLEVSDENDSSKRWPNIKQYT